MRNIIIISLLSIFTLGCIHKSNDKVLESNNLISDRTDEEPCIGTCEGQFKRLGSEKIGNTYYVYISGDKVDLTNDCCQYIFGEIAYNTLPNDTTTSVVKVYLIDLTYLEALGDSLESSNDDIKSKTMCVFVTNYNTGYTKIIADPFQYSIYEYPSDWP